MERASVTVVTPTRDRRERVLRLVAALDRQTFRDFETVVVDDGSRDGTGEALAGRCRVLRQAAAGIAAARNRGWKAAKGALVVFADDDVEPAADWLQELVTASERFPGAILQGKVLPNPRETDRLRGPFARSLTVTRLSPHFETANILYPRSVLERLGGFDETLTTAGEDTDLGQRARAAGVEARFVDTAVCFHAVHEQSLRGMLKDAARATDGVRAYRDHPHLREHLQDGIWYDQSHPMLIAAAAGIAMRRPAGAVFVAPYIAHLVREAHRNRGGIRSVPVMALRDAAQLAATVRGAARHRTWVL